MSKQTVLVKDSKITTSRSRLRAFLAVIGGAVLAANQAAYAALPTGIATGLTAMQSDFEDLIDLIWPFLIVVTTAFLVIKFFKRGSSKV
jgi:Phage major coat protein, Gp8